jgi:antitoxin ParD1/3/4
MANKVLRIELGAEQQAIIDRGIEVGRYEDANDVVNEALSLLGEREAEFDDWLREEVQASLADPSPPIPMEEVFERLEVRHAERMKATKRDGQ